MHSQITGKFTDHTVLPDDTYGKVIKSLIEVTNSGSKERSQKFLFINTTKTFLEALPIEGTLLRIHEFSVQHMVAVISMP